MPRTEATLDAEDEKAAAAAKHLDASALLDAMTPPAGFELTRALCSAYSAQSTVLVAMLLAMRRQATAQARGGAVQDLAQAFRALRGKVHFVLQHGRLTSPRRGRPLLHMLDRFIVHIEYDERNRSWHPKICLLRFASAEGKVIWRLWLGSRNFTRDTSWDLALLLEGSPDGKGKSVEGVYGLGVGLADAAKLTPAWETDLAELVRVKWRTQSGIRVSEVCLDLPNQKPQRTLPVAPEDAASVLVVSPFVDASVMRHFKGKLPASASLQIVSTETALAEIHTRDCAALAGYELNLLSNSVQEQLQEQDEDEDGPDSSADRQGLHAKFVWIRKKNSAELLLGSTNFTTRGWTENAEVRARLTMPSPGNDSVQELERGFDAFLSLCAKRDVDELPLVPLAEKKREEKFNRLRNGLAAELKLKQELLPGNDVIVHASTAPLLPRDATLRIGRCGDLLVDWLSGKQDVRLPAAMRHDNSEFVRLELRDGDYASAWLQAAPFSPELDLVSRDRALLQDALGLEGLLSMLNLTLAVNGSGGNTGPRKQWDEAPTDDTPAATLLGIEAALSAWVKDKGALQETAEIVAMARELKFDPKSHRQREAWEQLQAFLVSWASIAEVLLPQ